MSAQTTAPVQPATGAIAWGTDMLSGEIRPYYADQQPPATLAPIPPPAPLAVVQQRDVVPTRLLAGGASLSMVLGTAGAVAPQLEHVGHAIEMAGFGGGVLLLGVAAVRSGGARVVVNLVNNVTGSSSSASSNSNSSARASVWGGTK